MEALNSLFYSIMAYPLLTRDKAIKFESMVIHVQTLILDFIAIQPLLSFAKIAAVLSNGPFSMHCRMQN